MGDVNKTIVAISLKSAWFLKKTVAAFLHEGFTI